MSPSEDRVPPPDSLERTTPRCPIVDECGGCPWQAIAYPAQLERKRIALVRALKERSALGSVLVSPVRGLADPYGYRTKIQMPVGGRVGALVVGFFRPGTHEIVGVRTCAVQSGEGNRIVAEARDILNRARIEPYDERRHEGTLRYILLRVDASSGRAALTLVVRTDRLRGREKLAERLAAIRGVSGVFLNVQPARGNVVLGRRTERLAGRERVLVEVAGKRFLLSPTAFFQTNAEAAAILVERARAHLGGPFRLLADLYCGVGLFGRHLADRAARVIGVEENCCAVEDALAGLSLALRSGPLEARPAESRVEFVASEVERFIRDAPPVDAAVIDPPRAGCDPRVLEAIAKRLKPRALVYVSCSPATLARDLELLTSLGYRTRAVDPVDMFPHTPHLECVAALERAPAKR